ncbi:hypothetical protein [Oceanobacillus kimchii]|uniref:hypothetical protein n=1 Tax=Oceanobacillus kimchii TaxID=746691 RepID=UPI003C795443
MDHPMIEEMEQAGYLKTSHRREEYGVDGLGNEVFTGEEILIFADEIYLVEVLSDDAIEILEQHGATYKIAQ